MKPIIFSMGIVIVCAGFLIVSFIFNQGKPEAIASEIGTNNVTLTQNVSEKSSLADASQLKPQGNMDIDLSKAQTSATGLKYIEIQAGDGETPKRGQKVTVHYTGYLAEEGFKRGKKFDSSLDRNQPFTFTIGVGQVIKGWDEGVANMSVGTKSTLIIPPDLGYGARGAGGAIPPNSTLIFDVELLEIK
ncbi:FKBP-type peptidyl-prolyl cis-trans isomerase [Geminocystis sp. GBBB08]|uniref:FKBP-type peptidyl-prolyl cis-trans isomerase n=1 Tax=Geminocystis sp. GBBB08 TaxID=2604140 RepID=UPI0027E38CD6|nr:FKBP-type peptidyl-prolyl cis-trans isomerase [Geminocystis sp. GBBB08]MBL1211307.1 FKBP-type peptidyl-prolyl cis-trans isomerase [Geminocystis sp. GBBB08]